MAAATTTTVRTGGVNWGRYVLVGIATIVAATIANLIVFYIGGALVTYNPQFLPLLGPSPTIMFTVIPALLATIIYAPILWFARNPARLFTIIAVVALIISLIPDFTYIPTVEGASTGQTIILALMHIVAAVVITGMLTRLNPPRER